MAASHLSAELTSRLGFGCGRLVGGSSFKESAYLVEQAVNLGINYFDVAPSYGLGTAEDVLGEVLCGDVSFEIATKVGISRPKSAGTLSFLKKYIGPFIKRSSHLKIIANRYIKNKSIRNEFNEDFLNSSFEDSLSRLKRNSVNKLFLHEGIDNSCQQKTLQFFNRLVEQGRINHFGQATSGTIFTLGFGDSIQTSILAKDDDGILKYGSVSFHGVLKSELNNHERSFLYDNADYFFKLDSKMTERDCENVAKIYCAIKEGSRERYVLSFKCSEQMVRTLIAVDKALSSLS